jgi:hypothetical protein
MAASPSSRESSPQAAHLEMDWYAPAAVDPEPIPKRQNIAIIEYLEDNPCDYCWTVSPMTTSTTRGARLPVRETRLIRKNLRHREVSRRNNAKIFATVSAIPVLFTVGYLVFQYYSGTSDPAVLAGLQITFMDKYHSLVHNGTGITLKSLTVTCNPGGDAQPVTSTPSFDPPLPPGYEAKVTMEYGCKITRVNESHQLW